MAGPGRVIRRGQTGRHATVRATDFYRVTDGLIDDEIGQPDLLGLLGQIGALPSFCPEPR